jgi:protein-S-isoprenylcysteine O-methyltransferase Ste14
VDRRFSVGSSWTNVDWRAWRGEHPRLFQVMVLFKKLRTKVGLAAAAWCLAEGLLFDEVPFDLVRPNLWVVLGLMLIAAGVALRLAAYGNLRKKDVLATTGVYSLCRHPLYLGSILLTYGFCLLLDDVENYLFATVYFLVFYPLTIIWEEARLVERYGAAHEQYRHETPLLIPRGRFHAGGFGCVRALRAGGVALLVVTVLLLAGVEVMAKAMHVH